jgi:lipoprotein signal peptidase
MMACTFSGISGIVGKRAAGGSSLVLCERYEWPVFNLADGAIVVGAGLLILEILFSRSHHGHEVN